MLKRIKRLWELSGTDSNGQSISTPTHRLFTSESRRKRDQKLATILERDPLEDFNPPEDDTTSERPPTN